MSDNEPSPSKIHFFTGACVAALVGGLLLRKAVLIPFGFGALVDLCGGRLFLLLLILLVMFLRLTSIATGTATLSYKLLIIKVLKLSGHGRYGIKPIRKILVGIVLLVWLLPTSLVGASNHDLRLHKGPPIVDRFVACGAPGQRCCTWPRSIPGLDPRYCQIGAGCDIATNTCVTPCGGGGQVCCDGPDTYAPQGDRSPTGPLYCTNGNCSPRKQMCASGACMRETRRCDDHCGKEAGAACCAPDARIAVASCKAPDLICDFGTQGMTSGTCVPCGEQGKPPCPGDECRVSAGIRTMERNGICVACGYVGGPECLIGRKCDAGGAPDPYGPNCIPGGGKDQPCFEGKFCGSDGMFCDATNICRVCGQPGQPCCPRQPLLGGGVTKECGGYSNLQCANFNGRSVCQFKPGQGPGSSEPPPPPPDQPKTCGGQPYQIGTTTTVPVWIRQNNGCAVVGAAYQVNSLTEAMQCARTVYGDAVISEPVEEYTFSMDGLLGCRTVYIYSKDEVDARSCAQAQCTNCGEPIPGLCP